MLKNFLKATAVLLSITMAGSMTVFSQEGINLSYSADTYTFSISGKAEKAREPVYLQIYPFDTYKNNYAFLSPEELSNGEAAIVKTLLSGADRAVDNNLIIPSDGTIPAGRYIYKAASYQYDEYGIMIIMQSSLFTESIKAKVDSSDTMEIISALKDESLVSVIDDGNTVEAKYTYLAECIKNMKPAGGYNAQGFINSYLIAEGLYNLSAGHMTIQQMLAFYSMAYDMDYLSQYEALDTQAQSAVATLFKSNVIQKSFSKEFTDNIFAANYFASESSTKLKKEFIEYAKANSISLTDYEKLNSNPQRQENVFTYLYNTKTKLVPAGTIINSFNTAVTTQLNEQLQNGDDNGDDNSGNGGSTGGGGRDTTIVNTTTPESTGKFTDMKNHWSKEAVYKMADAGYINGYEDKTFRPDNSIKRSEFVKIICTAFSVNAGKEHCFTDVEEGSWYEEYVAAASSAGLVQGADGKFNPDNLITRQDAAVIIKRLLDMKGMSVNADTVKYNDYEKIASYALDAVNALSNLGLMKGYSGNINPTENLTRAEAATLLSRCAEHIK